MANQNDRFIDEVTEDLRRDRLFLMLRRYGWIALLLVVALVAGAAWREYSRARDTAAAQDFGDAILAAGASGDAAARAQALAEVPAGSVRQTVLRDILAANALVEAGNVAEAAQRFDAAAIKAGDDAVVRDLAALKSVIAQGAGMDPATRDAVLARLSASGAPFELIALELKAVALSGAGRRDDAVTLIRQIQQKDGLSQQMHQRLAEHLITLGVDPEPGTDSLTAPDSTPPAGVMPAVAG
ncbi:MULTISPECIES: hypothetical protein [unclassified Paracoccus (in: a-proteobacteria)]|uniref:hypothetical protein n=1 Tax=unclassified Paracoccus (in: a-proteobacteria) TaxID=2688777 RepID=UPI0015FF429B|nr:MULTISPECIES: hypothetical protein [unclassified Paracoccus (in: a-proteobacteria)]MBB1490762.1 hypothetical protein [Paracoccus sp. MC1854]MBB1497395.1 hypothetical protein [Paracoccus sp. MC1862]QQO45886.1 hypothetical protein JGR78_06175 [Paracoccus sp. MC1862]